MVCSFFYSETIEIIENFLAKNKNFKIEKYKPNIPLPVNIDNNSQYDISVGFTNNKTV